MLAEGQQLITGNYVNVTKQTDYLNCMSFFTKTNLMPKLLILLVNQSINKEQLPLTQITNILKINTGNLLFNNSIILSNWFANLFFHAHKINFCVK